GRDAAKQRGGGAPFHVTHEAEANLHGEWIDFQKAFYAGFGRGLVEHGRLRILLFRFFLETPSGVAHRAPKEQEGDFRKPWEDGEPSQSQRCQQERLRVAKDLFAELDAETLLRCRPGNDKT